MSGTGRARAGLGIPSFLAIVTAMALTVLGVLTFNDAQADAALQARHEMLSAAYYQACAQAEGVLARLDAAMTDALLRSADEADYAQRCTQLVQIEKTAITWTDDATAVLAVDAGYERQLRVQITRAAWDNAGESRFASVEKTLEDTAAWEADEPVSLIASVPGDSAYAAKRRA